MISGVLIGFPEGWGEEDEDGEEFEAAQEHEEGEEDFGGGSEEGKVFCGSNFGESWTNIEEAGNDPGENGDEIEIGLEGGHDGTAEADSDPAEAYEKEGLINLFLGKPPAIEFECVNDGGAEG